MVAMVRWDNAWNYTLASERPGNAGSCDGSCWKLLLIDQDYGQERAPLQRGVGGQRTLYLQRSQFELLKNPCVIYDGASPYSVAQKG